MNSLLNRERIVTIVCICFACWIYCEAGRFPTSILDTVGSSRYPRFLAIVIGIASAIHFICSGGESKAIKGRREFKALGVMLASVISYVLLMPRIGFIAATIPFLLVLTCYFDRREWSVKLKVAIPYAIIFTISMWLFFGKVLGVLLPGGILEG